MSGEVGQTPLPAPSAIAIAIAHRRDKPLSLETRPSSRAGGGEFIGKDFLYDVAGCLANVAFVMRD